jgi:hypothetical protein
MTPTRATRRPSRSPLAATGGGFAIAALAILALGVVAPARTPQAPKPTPEHERLRYFVGDWTTEGEMKASPMGPAGKISSKDHCEWFEGRFGVVCHATGTTPMGPAKSLGIMGYSAEEKVYTYYGIDNSGMVMTSVARGTAQGGTWNYTDEGMMGGQKYKSRVTIKELSPTAYTFTMEMQGPDGKWMPLVEAKSMKAAAK